MSSHALGLIEVLQPALLTFHWPFNSYSRRYEVQTYCVARRRWIRTLINGPEDSYLLPQLSLVALSLTSDLCSSVRFFVRPFLTFLCKTATMPTYLNPLLCFIFLQSITHVHVHHAYTHLYVYFAQFLPPSLKVSSTRAGDCICLHFCFLNPSSRTHQRRKPRYLLREIQDPFEFLLLFILGF